jgi:hypothetical protein
MLCIVMHILVELITVRDKFDFFFFLLVSYYFLVYLVTEDGWRKVWSSDTNDLFYEYYPVPQVQRK